MQDVTPENVQRLDPRNVVAALNALAPLYARSLSPPPPPYQALASALLLHTQNTAPSMRLNELVLTLKAVSALDPTAAAGADGLLPLPPQQEQRLQGPAQNAQNAQNAGRGGMHGRRGSDRNGNAAAARGGVGGAGAADAAGAAASELLVYIAEQCGGGGGAASGVGALLKPTENDIPLKTD